MQLFNSMELVQRFADIFAQEPKIFRAPGRVNLIGEHTDYNDGFVMPCALEFATRVAVSSRPDQRLILRSENLPQQFEFDTRNLPTQRQGQWCDYVIGVALALCGRGYAIPGANILVSSDIPIGAGLSSSAAIEVASALTLLSLTGGSLPMAELAKLCQEAENTYVGARVGIMDQLASCQGRADHALILDCRSLDFRLIPIPRSVCLVICNTMVKHQHASGEYNRRREQCEQGVEILRRSNPRIRALRDVSAVQLQAHRKQLPPTVFKRCLHVIEENQRVLQAAECLERANVAEFGKLMRESHKSLRELYEVSCPELDLMVEIGQGLKGSYGGRMTGGGFGGCTVNLVSREEASNFSGEISARYEQAIGIAPEVYVCSATNGAGADVEG